MGSPEDRLSADRSYYEAYEERYRTAHAKGVSWASGEPTPLVLETLRKYAVPADAPILELGCGEGRDARAVLDAGRRLLATDLSPEAIAWCRKKDPDRADCYGTLDALRGRHPFRYGFIYAVAVLHMLVEDADRDAFFRFIREHLTDEGHALICTMGDGETERRSDPREAFTPRVRAHPSGPMTVASTTCRMVSFPVFEAELRRNGLVPVEQGLAPSWPDFNELMYAVVQKAR